jgi:hypothetical protein
MHFHKIFLVNHSTWKLQANRNIVFDEMNS